MAEEEKSQKVEEIPVEKKIISPAEWAKKNLNIRPLTLPSGITVKVKNIDLQTMLTQGYIRTGLLNSLMSAQTKILENRENKKKDMEDVKETDLSEIDSLCRSFVVLAVIEPTISKDEVTSDEVINANDMDFNDCLFVFTECVRGGAEAFAPFRTKRSLRSDGRRSSTKVRKKTV